MYSFASILTLFYNDSFRVLRVSIYLPIYIPSRQLQMVLLMLEMFHDFFKPLMDSLYSKCLIMCANEDL